MSFKQCDHSTQQYAQHSLTCSDWKSRSGLEQHLKDSDFPASFTEVHLNTETGFSVTRINNHIDKLTFFRSFDGNADCLGTFHDLQEALSARGEVIMFPNKEQVKQVRNSYPKGARIKLVSMNNPYTSLKSGDRGTVSHVDDIGTIFVNWDSGSTLGVAYGEDVIKRIQMSDAVKEQILVVRATEETNMFDANIVQRIAFENGFNGLVGCDNFIKAEVTKKNSTYSVQHDWLPVCQMGWVLFVLLTGTIVEKPKYACCLFKLTFIVKLW